MKKPRKKYFKVKVEMPEDVSISEMRGALQDYISNPGNPWLRMNWDAVTVTPIKDTKQQPPRT